MTQVANGSILPDVKIQVTAASSNHESTVNSRRPDDFAFDQPFHMLEDWIAVIAGFGEFGVSVSAEQNGIRPVHAHEPQLA